jgi:hypothetical protein
MSVTSLSNGLSFGFKINQLSAPPLAPVVHLYQSSLLPIFENRSLEEEGTSVEQNVEQFTMLYA